MLMTHNMKLTKNKTTNFHNQKTMIHPNLLVKKCQYLFLCQLFTFLFLPVTHHHNLRQLVRYSNFFKASNESSGNGREGPSVSLVDNHAVKHSGCQTVL